MRNGDNKSHQINRFPFVFIINSDAVETPFHIYPFDTGAAIAKIFEDAEDPHVFLEDYELEPTFEAVNGHINWAFGSAEAYLKGDVKNNLVSEIPTYETVTRGYLDIAKLAATGNNKPDSRASAIEVALSHHLELKNNILLAILPKQYLETSGGNENQNIIDKLTDENIQWEVYDWQPNSVPNEFLNTIISITKNFYLTTDTIEI